MINRIALLFFLQIPERMDVADWLQVRSYSN